MGNGESRRHSWWSSSSPFAMLVLFTVPLLVVLWPWRSSVLTTSTSATITSSIGTKMGSANHEAIVNGSSFPPISTSSRELQQPGGKKEGISSSNSNLPPLVPSMDDPKYSSVVAVEAGLESPRAAITEVDNVDHMQDPDYIPRGLVYRNATGFHRSYLEMEKGFKVFVYEEGDSPLFHYGPTKGIYSIEGHFIRNMEISHFRTKDPENAQVYFLPFSVKMISQVIYMDDSSDWRPMESIVKDYVDVIARKYRYWNRSLGADHFMLACSDWAPNVTMAVPNLHNSSIRALCNANTTEDFNPSRDVSIPEINLPTGTTEGMLGGPPPSQRSILVFFSGGLHGPIRPILHKHWENNDPDVQVHQYLPKNISYYGMMRKSKFCICPSGYEVASPRMVEAIYMGCVPVLIKEHYVMPFSEVLDWKTFSVVVSVKDIPNLKKILKGISSSEYLKMQKRGVQVRKHFVVNSPPKRYDVFHMILHSVWLRRPKIRVPGIEER